MEFTISPKRTARILVLVVMFLTFVGVAAKVVRVFWGYGGILEAASLFDTGKEETIPTWYSSLALLLCSVLLATIAAAKKRECDRYARHWGALSVLFLLLSIDEVATIHETLGYEVGAYLLGSMNITPTSFIYHVWVLPGAVFVLVVLLAYLRFLSHLPKKTRLLFLLAGALFVLGAIGVEMLEAQQLYFFSYESGEAKWRDLPVDVKVWSSVRQSLEEALEMLSIVVFIYAMLSYMSSLMKEVTVRIGTKGE